MRRMVRIGILSVLIAAAIAAMLVGLPSQSSLTADLPVLSYVTTARQFGVVGYRDPFGAISPDGKRLAYAEGRFIRVVPIGGGAPVTLEPGEGQIRFLAWTSSSQIVAEDVTPSGRWWQYELGRQGRWPAEPITGRPTWPAVRASGEVACISNRRLTLPCGATPLKLDGDREVHGPIAFSPDGTTVYFSSPSD
jgi:WD40-like Beta Propeller Repeat